MSKKNTRNRSRHDYFRNYTTKIKERNIIVEKGTPINTQTQAKIKKANNKANLLIQRLNILIETRQLPYVLLKIVCNSYPDAKTRIMLHNAQTTDSFEKRFKESVSEVDDHTEISHIVDILVALGCNDLTNSYLKSDLGMVMDPDLTIEPIIDILIDISMFNSYSFLKNMSTNEKRLFNKVKVEYIMNKLTISYYSLSTPNPAYLSFAFAARNQEGQFDINKYMKIWDDFITWAYPESVHIEKTINQQLKQHVDYGNLPKNIEKQFSDKADGCYLLLRKNKVRSKKLEEDIRRLFKKKKAIIIPMYEFERYERFFKNLDVSVFKIVKTTQIGTP